MSALPVAAYLPELGLERGSQDGRARPPGVHDSKHSREPSAALWERKLEEAYAKGLDHGTAAGRAALESRVEELERELGARLAAEREAWASEQGMRLAEQIAAGLEALEESIAEAVARILEPFLAAELRQQALAELRTVIGTLVASKDGVALSICGPQDLLDALRRGLEGKACSVTYSPQSTCEVQVVAGQTVFETLLSAWAAKIEEAMR